MALGSSAAAINVTGNIELVNGTSIATPIIAGLATGLIQAMPTSTNVEIANAIRASGDRVLNPNNGYGYGIPNFETALSILKRPEAVVEDNILLYPNPSSNNIVFVKFDDANYGLRSQIQLISLGGRVLMTSEFTPNNVNDMIQLDISQNPPGIYLFRLINSNGKFTRKLIKY